MRGVLKWLAGAVLIAAVGFASPAEVPGGGTGGGAGGGTGRDAGGGTGRGTGGRRRGRNGGKRRRKRDWKSMT